MFGTDPKRISGFAQANPEIKNKIRIISSTSSQFLSLDEVEQFPNLEEIHTPLVIPLQGKYLEKILSWEKLSVLKLSLVDLTHFFSRLAGSFEEDSESDEDFQPDRGSDREAEMSETSDENYSPDREAVTPPIPSRWLRKRPRSPTREGSRSSPEAGVKRPCTRQREIRASAESQASVAQSRLKSNRRQEFLKKVFPLVVRMLGERAGAMDLAVSFLERKEEVELSRDLVLSPHFFTLRGGFLRCYPALHAEHAGLVEEIAQRNSLKGIYLDGRCHPRLPRGFLLKQVVVGPGSDKKTRQMFLPRARKITLLFSAPDAGEVRDEEGEEPSLFLERLERELEKMSNSHLRELAAPLSPRAIMPTLERFPCLEVCGARAEDKEDLLAIEEILTSAAAALREKGKSTSFLLAVYRAEALNCRQLLEKAEDLGVNVSVRSLEALFSPQLNGSLSPSFPEPPEDCWR